MYRTKYQYALHASGSHIGSPDLTYRRFESARPVSVEGHSATEDVDPAMVLYGSLVAAGHLRRNGILGEVVGDVTWQRPLQERVMRGSFCGKGERAVLVESMWQLCW